MGRKRKFYGNQHVAFIQEKKPKLIHLARNILEDDAVYTIESTILSQEIKKKLNELKNYLVANISVFEEKIFLTAKKYDEKRKQINFDNFISKVNDEKKKEYFTRLLANIRTSLLSHISAKYPGFSLSVGNILMSLPGGSTQSWHMDFDGDSNYEYTPLVFFMGISTCRLELAIDDNTKKQTKPLNLGDLLTFNGFTLHRGCKYSEINFRFHWYAVHKDDKINNIDGEDTFIF